ncbi:MAG: hypothetical protein ACI9P5_002107 [Saprospiraceae bacterium]
MTLSYSRNDSQSVASIFLENRIAAGETGNFTIKVQSVNYEKYELIEISGSTSGTLKLYDNFDFVNLVAETSCTVATTKIKENGVLIYPNPTADFFQLENDADIYSISIYSLLGKQISTLHHSEGEVHNISILRTGLYLVRLINKDGKVVKAMRLSKR